MDMASIPTLMEGGKVVRLPVKYIVYIYNA